MCSCTDRVKSACGQATVEAAFLIPLIFVLLLLLIQPAILLYDRTVMQSAAAEGCRMLATKTAAMGMTDDEYKEAIIRHLGAIPQQDNFHVHSGGCTWGIDLEGDEGSSSVAVLITTQVKPLPFLDMGAVLLGMANDSGNLEVKVSASAPTQDSWVAGNELGMNPAAWVEKWV